jgi:arylsulfatase A-like enzyme
MSQIDLLASLAALTGQKLTSTDATDSVNSLDALLGNKTKNRAYVVEHALNGTLSIIKDNWKYIEPGNGPKIGRDVNIEMGNDSAPQLYNLTTDLGEQNNVASQNPQIVKELVGLLQQVKGEEGSYR